MWVEGTGNDCCKKKVLSLHGLHSLHSLHGLHGLQSAVCSLHGLRYGVTDTFMVFMTFIAVDVERFFFLRLQICIQLLLEVNPRRQFCYKYKYSGSHQLTYFRNISLEFS